MSARHVLHQGPVLAALARTGWLALRGHGGGSAEAPGPWLEEVVPARSDELIDDYVRHVGGSRSAYRKTVPPHLFPQWTFPLQARCLEGLPYPMHRVLNAGARVETNGPLPRGQALHLKARLDDVDDDGRRAVLRFLTYTGTASEPELVKAELFAHVPLGGGDKKKKKSSRAPARVPHEAREIAGWRLDAKDGLEFAQLTGDFNPVHWVPPYARAFGFRNVILHGFSTMARAWEDVVRVVFAGDATRMKSFGVRFTKPLVLPAKPKVFLERPGNLSVGDAHGARAYLIGSFES